MFRGWRVAVWLIFASCSFQLNGSTLQLNGNSFESQPEPAAKKAAEPAAPEAPAAPAAREGALKAPPSAPSASRAPAATPTASAEKPVPAKVAEQPDAVPAKGARARSEWDGTYGGPPDLQCGSEDGILFKTKGPADQVVEASTPWYTSGPRCPSTCGFPSSVSVKNGKLVVPVIWVDYQPSNSEANTTRVTMHRTLHEVDLVTQSSAQNSDKKHPHFGVRSNFGARGYMAGATDVHFSPRRWATNGYSKINDTSHLRLDATLVSVKDKRVGTGRALVLSLRLDARGTWHGDGLGGCQLDLMRSDFQPGEGDGGDGGDDDDDSGSSSSERGSKGSSGVDRKCRARCKSEAGECRKDCHGQSAKCANECNRTERACLNGC